MNRSRAVALPACLLLTVGAWAPKPPLLPEKDVAALANELSGETAKRNLEGKAKGVRNVKLRSVADVKRPGVKRLIVDASELNRKDPPSGMMLGMDKRRKKESASG